MEPIFSAHSKLSTHSFPNGNAGRDDGERGDVTGLISVTQPSTAGRPIYFRFMENLKVNALTLVPRHVHHHLQIVFLSLIMTLRLARQIGFLRV